MGTAQKNPGKKVVDKKQKNKVWKFLNSPLIIALIPATISYFAAVATTSKKINNLKLEFQQQITSSQTQSQTIVSDSSGSTLSPNDEMNPSDRSSNSFNSSNWMFTKDMIPNKEGFYCPKSPNFPSWSMWTKNRYKADSEISITFSLLDKTDNKKNPTFYISYGDKTSDAPDAFYRFNVFDGDLNTLRLYDREENEVVFERSKNDAPMDKFITLTISPVFLNKKSSTLTLNPVVSYQLDGQEYSFEPEKFFEIDLPLSSGKNQGDGFQYGLGISKGDCFKIISSSL